MPSAPLAYVFWHWKQADVAAKDYETRQRTFHAALSASPPTGYLESLSAAIARAPWSADSGEIYEDWYLVQDFAALGSLNEGAVSASRTAPHSAAAEVAANGTAGLYSLRIGAVVRRAKYGHWFNKPAGMSYAELDAQLGPLVQQAQGALWIRQMTLGPTPEFCLHAEAAVPFPPQFTTLEIPLRSVWPEQAPS